MFSRELWEEQKNSQKLPMGGLGTVIAVGTKPLETWLQVAHKRARYVLGCVKSMQTMQPLFKVTAV